MLKTKQPKYRPSDRFIFPDKNRLPNSKAIEKARLQTYSIGEGWTHDQTRNHGASSKKVCAQLKRPIPRFNSNFRFRWLKPVLYLLHNTQKMISLHAFIAELVSALGTLEMTLCMLLLHPDFDISFILWHTEKNIANAIAIVRSSLELHLQ